MLMEMKPKILPSPRRGLKMLPVPKGICFSSLNMIPFFNSAPKARRFLRITQKLPYDFSCLKVPTPGHVLSTYRKLKPLRTLISRILRVRTFSSSSVASRIKTKKLPLRCLRSEKAVLILCRENCILSRPIWTYVMWLVLRYQSL